MNMKRLIIFLAYLLMTTTVPAQDHHVRRQPKSVQQTKTKPVAKPQSKPVTKPSSRPVSKARSSQPSNVPLCPDNHHPHMIDLGLPSGTKWACCNVGADKPEAYGGYYAWGETETKYEYSWKTYKYCDGTSNCKSLGWDIADTSYDVAHVKWGDRWVLPLHDQQEELMNNCTCKWMTMNGVAGEKFTSKRNGASIFLPAAGYRDDSGLDYVGSYGFYWSSTQNPSYSHYAYYLDFNSANVDWYGISCYLGQSVRPVSSN